MTDTAMTMTREEIKEVAGAAADEAVRKMLLALGVDATNANAIIEMQADFRHLRTWRKGSDTIKEHGLKVVVGTVVTAIVGYIAVILGLRAAGGH
jgi:hypothetical protein